MKVLISAVAVITISAINSFEVKKIEGVEGDVRDVLFDSKYNSYIYSSDAKVHNIERLQKLDPENNVIFVKEFVDFSCRIILNHIDELYLICGANNDISTDVNIIRVDSTEIEKITTLDGYLLGFIFQDDSGNLMYNGYSPGFFFLKYNTTQPVSVKNLEYFVKFGDAAVTDSKGNTFIGGNSYQENQFVVISADSKQGTPKAFIFSKVLYDTTLEHVDYLTLTSNDEIIIGIVNGFASTASLKKIYNGTLTIIYGTEKYDRYLTYFGKSRTLIFAFDFSNDRCRITSLNSNGEVVGISNPVTWTSEAKGVSIDDDGNAFIDWPSAKEEKSHLEYLGSTDTATVEVDLGNIKFIQGTVFDGNDNLWIKTDEEVYFIEKGTLKLEIVPGLTNYLLDMWVNTKKKANEVYVNTNYEFYVISN